MSSMSMEELKSLYQVPHGVSLQLSDGLACFAVEQADNTVFFTQEQFAARLRFPVSSLVKQFLHVT